jgi:hypothetical protein
LHLLNEKYCQALEKSDCFEKRQRKLPASLVVCLVIAMSLWSSDSMETVLKNLVNGLNREWTKLGQYWKTPNSSSITMARQKLVRRKWSSTYEALQDSRPNRNKLMRRYIEEIPSLEYVLLGIDDTAWGRRGAKTLQDRTYEHQASSNNSVTVGQEYSTIAWLPEKPGSWAMPLRHERISSYEKPISKAVWQQYARRFGVDHWYRFTKQRLHWTLPNLGTAKQSERWSDLMPLMTWQLWLAKDLVEDHHLFSYF